MAKEQASIPVETSRVEFVEDNILIVDRVYRRGDVAEIPTDRLKDLGPKVRSTDKDVTDFSKTAVAEKPKK